MKTAFTGWRYLWKSEDIRRKLLITLGILALYRLAANVPVPGVDFEALRRPSAPVVRAPAASLGFSTCSQAVPSRISPCSRWVSTRTLPPRLSCSS